MVVSRLLLLLLPWRWGICGMSNLIVGVHGGGGVEGLGVREGALTSGARCMWNRPLLKPLKEEESDCQTLEEENTGGQHASNKFPRSQYLANLMTILLWIKLLELDKRFHVLLTSLLAA